VSKNHLSFAYNSAQTPTLYLSKVIFCITFIAAPS